MSKKAQIILYSAVIVILSGTIIWLLASYRAGGKEKYTLSTSTSASATGEKLYDNASIAKETVTVSTEIIEDGLKDLGKLVTQEYYFTQVETYEKTETVILKSTARITYSYDGVVSAGIDCDKITVTKDDEKKVITISLPASEIQYVEIDTDSFQVYEEKQGLWSKIKLSDVNKSLTEFKESAKEKALDKGLLDNADKNAETIIDRFVNSIIQTEAEGYSINYVHM